MQRERTVRGNQGLPVLVSQSALRKEWVVQHTTPPFCVCINVCTWYHKKSGSSSPTDSLITLTHRISGWKRSSVTSPETRPTKSKPSKIQTSSRVGDPMDSLGNMFQCCAPLLVNSHSNYYIIPGTVSIALSLLPFCSLHWLCWVLTTASAEVCPTVNKPLQSIRSSCRLLIT